MQVVLYAGDELSGATGRVPVQVHRDLNGQRSWDTGEKSNLLPGYSWLQEIPELDQETGSQIKNK